MKRSKTIYGLRKILFFLVLVLSLSSFASFVSCAFPQPTSPDSAINKSSTAPSPSMGSMVNVSGGSITVINFTATTQNSHWKGFVGNVSGRLALRDAKNNSLYDWQMTAIVGEIYATRSQSILDWDNISCVKPYMLKREQSLLNVTNSNVDSINLTFNETSHLPFYAGTTSIGSDSCRSTNLYVGGQKTSAFAEVLLQDSDNVLYTAILEDSKVGFDGGTYDFQMILPDRGLDASTEPNVPYYFYIELI